MDKSTLVWLDDFRNPVEDDWLVFSPIKNPSKVIWVKNYEEFVEYIKNNGIPTAISFDHDLHPLHYSINMTALDWKNYYDSKNHIETGYHAALWLKNYCLENNFELPIIGVHSANNVGKLYINSLFE